jgi:hypothetical protein
MLIRLLATILIVLNLAVPSMPKSMMGMEHSSQIASSIDHLQSDKIASGHHKSDQGKSSSKSTLSYDCALDNCQAVALISQLVTPARAFEASTAPLLDDAVRAGALPDLDRPPII